MLRRNCAEVRYFSAPPTLARYFSEIYTGRGEIYNSRPIVDLLPPMGAQLRFYSEETTVVESLDGQYRGAGRFVASGPTRHALRVRHGGGRIWGLGLTPLGWATLMGVPASTMADRVVDGTAHPLFAGFAPLLDGLFGAEVDLQAEYERICAFFLARVYRVEPDAVRIEAIERALADPSLGSVGALAARTGLSASTVERICARCFGFKPKLLLRRERFCRSLMRYMSSRATTWLDAMDSHYHDQAQFVREFQAFMGLSPRAYMSEDHLLIQGMVAAQARRMEEPEACQEPRSHIWGLRTPRVALSRGEGLPPPRGRIALRSRPA